MDNTSSEKQYSLEDMARLTQAAIEHHLGKQRITTATFQQEYQKLEECLIEGANQQWGEGVAKSLFNFHTKVILAHAAWTASLAKQLMLQKVLARLESKEITDHAARILIGEAILDILSLGNVNVNV